MSQAKSSARDPIIGMGIAEVKVNFGDNLSFRDIHDARPRKQDRRQWDTVVQFMKGLLIPNGGPTCWVTETS